jgi:carbamate kinase
MRVLQTQGQFASGSMGPKVDAVCRFVESTGHVGVITSLPNIEAGVHGGSGTRVLPDHASDSPTGAPHA